MVPKSRPTTDPGIKADAESYLGHPIGEPSVTVPDPVESKKTAAAYEQMKHAPHDPQVKASYDAMKRGVKAQWDHLVSRGVKFEPWAAEGQPYRNSAEMRADATENRHLYYYRTEAGYGEHGKEGYDHPMLEEMYPGVPYNDAFRAVHDYFGHALHGHQFGPTGEYRAWVEHAKMFPKEAHGALTNETHGQNSWVNFGPHSHLPMTERPYAENKAGLLPEHAWPKVKLSMGGMGTIIPLQIHTKQWKPGMEPPVTQWKPGMQPPKAPEAPKPVALGNSLNRGHVVTFSRPGSTQKVTRTVTTTLGPEQLRAKMAAAGYEVHDMRPSTPEDHQASKHRTIREAGKLSRQEERLGEVEPFARAIGATGGVDRLPRAVFADWLEERGKQENDATLDHLRHHEGPVGIYGTMNGKIGALPATVEHIDALRAARGLTPLGPITPGGSHPHVTSTGKVALVYPLANLRGGEQRWHYGLLHDDTGVFDWTINRPHLANGFASEQEARDALHREAYRRPFKLSRVTATRIHQQGIHRAFRGTALAYHLMKLADHAREKYGAKANPLLLQIRGILAGKKELNLRQFGDNKVSPFAAVGRYLKQFGGHAVPEELHGLADRFKWTTSDRRHDLDRQLYDLAADKWGEHRADDGIREMYRRLHRGDDATRRGITDAFRKHLKVELPSGDHHQEIMDSIARLHSYAQDRRMVAEGSGKTKGGNVHWRDWFEHAANPFAQKRSDPMRLSREFDFADPESHRKVLDANPTGVGPHRMAMADDLLERGLLHDDDSFATLANHNGPVALYRHPDSGKIHVHGVEGDQEATSAAIRLVEKRYPQVPAGILAADWGARHPKVLLKAKYSGPGDRFVTSSILPDGTVAALRPMHANIFDNLEDARRVFHQNNG